MTTGQSPPYLRIDDDEELPDDDLLKVVWSRYDFVSVGQSYRRDGARGCARVGQIARIGEVLQARRHVAAALTSALIHEDLQLPIVAEGNEHAFMMYPLVCLRPGMARSPGRRVGTWWCGDALPPSHSWSAVLRGILEYSAGRFPVAEHALKNGFYIGSHQGMSAADVEHVSEIIPRRIALADGDAPCNDVSRDRRVLVSLAPGSSPSSSAMGSATSSCRAAPRTISARRMESGPS